eukprot:4548684-Prymnesium_polylepis.1
MVAPGSGSLGTQHRAALAGRQAGCHNQAVRERRYVCSPIPYRWMLLQDAATWRSVGERPSGFRVQAHVVVHDLRCRRRALQCDGTRKHSRSQHEHDTAHAAISQPPGDTFSIAAQTVEPER